MIVRAWNTVYCDVARANGFYCADLSTRSNGPDGVRPSGDLVAAGLTHPSKLGQDAILDLLLAFGYGPLEPQMARTRRSTAPPWTPSLEEASAPG